MIGILFFIVKVVFVDGIEEEYDNNGNQYFLQDDVFFQVLQSCVCGFIGVFIIVVVVFNDVLENGVGVRVLYKMIQVRSLIFNICNVIVELLKGCCVGQYMLYFVEYMIEGDFVYEVIFDIMSGSKLDSFKCVVDIGGICCEFINLVLCNVEEEFMVGDFMFLLLVMIEFIIDIEEFMFMSDDEEIIMLIIVEFMVSLYYRKIMGEYNFVLCWIEGNGICVFSGQVMVDDEMIFDMCLEFCDDFVYWGIEYG